MEGKGSASTITHGNEARFSLGGAVRAAEIDDRPWFVASDVCRVLGASVDAGARPWLRPLTPDEKSSFRG